VPPRLPSSAAADFVESGSSLVSSPIAMRITITALPITPVGASRPLGPLGTDIYVPTFTARNSPVCSFSSTSFMIMRF